MDSRFEKNLYVDLQHLVEETDAFESVTADIPMFSNTGSSWVCYLTEHDPGAVIYFNIPIVDFYLYYESAYGNHFNGVLQKVYKDLLNNVEQDYLKEHPEDTELEGMDDWFINSASGDNSYWLQVELLVTFLEGSSTLALVGSVAVNSYSDVYRYDEIQIFHRNIVMEYIDSNQNRFKEQFFNEVLTSFNDLIEELYFMFR